MNNKIELVKINESYVRIVCDMSILLELRDRFSFMVDGYRFSPKYQYGNWDGKICLIKKDLLPLGLIDAVKSVAKNFDYELILDPALNIYPYFSDKEFDYFMEDTPVYSKGNKIAPYWYQEDAIKYGINHKRCILNLPTSAGKSLIQGMLSKWYTDAFDNKNVLLLVPTIQLTDQMKTDLMDYQLFEHDDINIVRGGSTDIPGARITVGTWQSIKKRGAEYMSQFGMLLVDEVHLATGTSISDIITHLTECEYKIGLSGSLKDGKANVLNYIGLFGSVFAPVSTRQLADQGFISDLDIKVLFLKHDADTSKLMKGKSYQDEIKYITNDIKRNSIVINLANKLAKGENVLLLFKNISHGKDLYKRLCKLHGDDNVEYVAGDVKREERLSISESTEERVGRIVVASYGTFSTGISIKNLHHVILAHPVKSKIIIIQSIGRSLRKHDSKGKAKIWDVVDSFEIMQKNGKKSKYRNYALKHGLERLKIYIENEFDYKMRTIELG